MEIILPPYVNIRNARAIIKRCAEATYSGDGEILFNLQHTSFLDPFGITILAGKMLSLVNRGVKVKYRKPLQFPKTDKYLESIGFYEFGQAKCPKSYETQVELKLFKALDPTFCARFLEVMQYDIHMSEGVVGSLTMSLNELMNNTFEHSKSPIGCLSCAQTYHNEKTINICITDFGIGILQALKTREEYADTPNSVAAIELATQAGVTSRSSGTGGLGLSHIQRFLMINNGQIHIISGEGWVHWDYSSQNTKITKKHLMNFFPGTIINIMARADAEGIYLLKSESLPDDDIF